MTRQSLMFEITIEDVTVELEDIGEGISGDYDPEDKEDIPLLRFTVLKNGEPIDDASYCTQVPTTISVTEATKVLSTIMNEVFEPVIRGYSIKKMCERLSWIDSTAWVPEVNY